MDVGNLTFDVRASGPEDGRPVLLLHGFPQTSLSWAAVTPLLTGAGLRCYAPDQLGYSPGARPGDVGAYALPSLAQATADLMTALDVPVADVVGHDWGANVGWALRRGHGGCVPSAGRPAGARAGPAVRLRRGSGGAPGGWGAVAPLRAGAGRRTRAPCRVAPSPGAASEEVKRKRTRGALGDG